jgi:hypothetical protein
MIWRRTSRSRFLMLVRTDWMGRGIFLLVRKSRGMLGRSGLCLELGC